MRMLLVLIATIGAGLLFALAGQVRRPLAQLFRLLLSATATVLAIAGLAIAVAALSSETWWAAVVGGGLLAVAARIAWKLRRPRSRAQPEHVPLTATVPEPHWRELEPHLDWVSRQQARKARTAIARFLAERDSPSLTVDHRSLLISCDKRVPELIDICIERCRNAAGEERRHYIDSTLDALVQIGAQADQARREVRQADDRRLQVLHRYFDRVAGPKDDGRNLP